MAKVLYAYYDDDFELKLTEGPVNNALPMLVVDTEEDDDAEGLFTNIVITDLKRIHSGAYDTFYGICKITRKRIGLVIYKNAFIYANDLRLRRINHLNNKEQELMSSIAEQASEASYDALRMRGW